MEHIILNCETGEISAIPLTEEEKAEQEATAKKVLEANKLLKEQETKAEADKAALFARLGITAEEAALLFGGTN